MQKTSHPACALLLASAAAALLFGFPNDRAAAQEAKVVAQGTVKPILSAQDHVEILNLYARYNRALDMSDGPGRVATFTPDGTFSTLLGDHKPERMDIVSKRTTERGNSGARHIVVNVELTPTAEGVDGFAYLLLVTDNPNSDGVIRGRHSFYVDKLVKTPDGWRFKSRETWGDSEPNSPYAPKKKPVTAATAASTAAATSAATAARVDVSAPVSGTTEQQVAQMEERLRKATAARDYPAVAALYWDNAVDIHGSGWIYTRDESVELLKNRLEQGPGRKVLKSDQVDWKIIPQSDDTAIATGISETYFEVPNPQLAAMAAGALTRSPNANATPADTSSASNLYRIRSVRVWVRKNGQWKIASAQATRVGERLNPGR